MFYKWVHRDTRRLLVLSPIANKWWCWDLHLPCSSKQNGCRGGVYSKCSHQRITGLEDGIWVLGSVFRSFYLGIEDRETSWIPSGGVFVNLRGAKGAWPRAVHRKGGEWHERPGGVEKIVIVSWLDLCCVGERGSVFSEQPGWITISTRLGSLEKSGECLRDIRVQMFRGSSKWRLVLALVLDNV